VYSDGSREDYIYTGDNLLDTLTNTKADGAVIDSYTYSYDAADNMVSKTDARGTTTYTYDRLNRLVSVTEPSGQTTSYTFDASGNRKSILPSNTYSINRGKYSIYHIIIENL